MLLFIPDIRQNISPGKHVSIHHMLLFITIYLVTLMLITSFNTSHVTVYLSTVVYKKLREFVSIHHMLLFIPTGFCLPVTSLLFQYITCYCLSPSAVLPYYPQTVFQYITCYCLSLKPWKFMRYMPSFNTSHVTVYHCTCCLQLGSY